MVYFNVAAVAKFERSVLDFAETLPVQLVSPYIRKIALEALARLIAKTPVRTGRARGGWFVTFGSPAGFSPLRVDKLLERPPIAVTSSEDLPEPISLATEATAYEAALATLRGYRPYDMVWIQNNVAYIAVLEAGRIESGRFRRVRTAFGDITSPGYSGSIQAPLGMLSVTVRELQEMFA